MVRRAFKVIVDFATSDLAFEVYFVAFLAFVYACFVFSLLVSLFGFEGLLCR